MKRHAKGKSKTESEDERPQREERWSNEQRLQGRSFKYPSDNKITPAENAGVHELRMIRGCGAQPVRPHLRYTFEYKLPPSEETLTRQFHSCEWRTVTDGFRRIIGPEAEVIRIIRTPYNMRTRQRTYCSPGGGAKPKDSAFVSNSRFASRYASYNKFIRDKARRLAHGEPLLEDEAAAAGLRRLGATDSDDPETLQHEILKAMRTVLRMSRKINQKK
jgi:hypothetical protein